MRGAVLATLLVVVLGPSGSLAESATPGRVLVVAVADVPPFAIKGEDGTWTGLSIELWRLVADELDSPLEVRAVARPGHRRRSAESVGRRRARRHRRLPPRARRPTTTPLPYLTTGLGFAEPAKRGPSWRTMVRALVGSGRALDSRRHRGGDRSDRRADRRHRTPAEPGAVRWLAAPRHRDRRMVGGCHHDDGRLRRRDPGRAVSGRSVALVWMFVGVAAVSDVHRDHHVGAHGGIVAGTWTVRRTSSTFVSRPSPAGRRPSICAYTTLASPPIRRPRKHCKRSPDGDVDATLAPVPALRYLVSRRWQGSLAGVPDRGRADQLRDRASGRQCASPADRSRALADHPRGSLAEHRARVAQGINERGAQHAEPRDPTSHDRVRDRTVAARRRPGRGAVARGTDAPSPGTNSLDNDSMDLRGRTADQGGTNSLDNDSMDLRGGRRTRTARTVSTTARSRAATRPTRATTKPTRIE